MDHCVNSPKRRRVSGSSGPLSNPMPNYDATKRISSKPVQVIPICGLCLGNSQSNTRTNSPEDLIACWSCGRAGHPSCLKMPKELVENIRHLRWLCVDCKRCSLCQPSGRRLQSPRLSSSGSPPVNRRRRRMSSSASSSTSSAAANANTTQKDLLLCDQCDRGFHLHCLQPPLDQPPEGTWFCPICYTQSSTLGSDGCEPQSLADHLSGSEIEWMQDQLETADSNSRRNTNGDEDSSDATVAASSIIKPNNHSSRIKSEPSSTTSAVAVARPKRLVQRPLTHWATPSIAAAPVVVSHTKNRTESSSSTTSSTATTVVCTASVPQLKRQPNNSSVIPSSPLALSQRRPRRSTIASSPVWRRLIQNNRRMPPTRQHQSNARRPSGTNPKLRINFSHHRHPVTDQSQVDDVKSLTDDAKACDELIPVDSDQSNVIEASSTVDSVNFDSGGDNQQVNGPGSVRRGRGRGAGFRGRGRLLTSSASYRQQRINQSKSRQLMSSLGRKRGRGFQRGRGDIVGRDWRGNRKRLEAARTASLESTVADDQDESGQSRRDVEGHQEQTDDTADDWWSEYAEEAGQLFSDIQSQVQACLPHPLESSLSLPPTNNPKVVAMTSSRPPQQPASPSSPVLVADRTPCRDTRSGRFSRPPVGVIVNDDCNGISSEESNSSFASSSQQQPSLKTIEQQKSNVVEKKLDDHEQQVTQRNPPQIQIGRFIVTTWYSAPYPSEYARLNLLYLCEFCLKPMKTRKIFLRHMEKCTHRYPPGNEIYRSGQVSIFEVDGSTSRLYCQHLCLLAKLFLDHKTLYFDVEHFLFYVVVERLPVGSGDQGGDNCLHLVGYFSKEKRSAQRYNLSCIMVLPPYQNKCYGRLLIEFSYLLSRTEGQLGSPEKPLSELGRLSYESYWRSKLLPFLFDQQQPEEDDDHQPRLTNIVNLYQIGSSTGIHTDDLAATLQSLTSSVQLQRDRPVFRFDRDHLLELKSKYDRRSANWINIDPECLRWSPLLNVHELDASVDEQHRRLRSRPNSPSSLKSDPSTVFVNDSNKRRGSLLQGDTTPSAPATRTLRRSSSTLLASPDSRPRRSRQPTNPRRDDLEVSPSSTKQNSSTSSSLIGDEEDSGDDCLFSPTSSHHHRPSTSTTVTGRVNNRRGYGRGYHGYRRGSDSLSTNSKIARKQSSTSSRRNQCRPSSLPRPPKSPPSSPSNGGGPPCSGVRRVSGRLSSSSSNNHPVTRRQSGGDLVGSSGGSSKRQQTLPIFYFKTSVSECADDGDQHDRLTSSSPLLAPPSLSPVLISARNCGDYHDVVDSPLSQSSMSSDNSPDDDDQLPPSLSLYDSTLLMNASSLSTSVQRPQQSRLENDHQSSRSNSPSSTATTSIMSGDDSVVALVATVIETTALLSPLREQEEPPPLLPGPAASTLSHCLTTGPTLPLPPPNSAKPPKLTFCYATPSSDDDSSSSESESISDDDNGQSDLDSNRREMVPLLFEPRSVAKYESPRDQLGDGLLLDDNSSSSSTLDTLPMLCPFTAELLLVSNQPPLELSKKDIDDDVDDSASLASTRSSSSDNRTDSTVEMCCCSPPPDYDCELRLSSNHQCFTAFLCSLIDVFDNDLIPIPQALSSRLGKATYSIHSDDVHLYRPIKHQALTKVDPIELVNGDFLLTSVDDHITTAPISVAGAVVKNYDVDSLHLHITNPQKHHLRPTIVPSEAIANKVLLSLVASQLNVDESLTTAKPLSVVTLPLTPWRPDPVDLDDDSAVRPATFLVDPTTTSYWQQPLIDPLLLLDDQRRDDQPAASRVRQPSIDSIERLSESSDFVSPEWSQLGSFTPPSQSLLPPLGSPPPPNSATVPSTSYYGASNHIPHHSTTTSPSRSSNGLSTSSCDSIVPVVSGVGKKPKQTPARQRGRKRQTRRATAGTNRVVNILPYPSSTTSTATVGGFHSNKQLLLSNYNYTNGVNCFTSSSTVSMPPVGNYFPLMDAKGFVVQQPVNNLLSTQSFNNHDSYLTTSGLSATNASGGLVTNPSMIMFQQQPLVNFVPVVSTTTHCPPPPTNPVILQDTGSCVGNLSADPTVSFNNCYPQLPNQQLPFINNTSSGCNNQQFFNSAPTSVQFRPNSIDLLSSYSLPNNNGPTAIINSPPAHTPSTSLAPSFFPMSSPSSSSSVNSATTASCNQSAYFCNDNNIQSNTASCCSNAMMSNCYQQPVHQPAPVIDPVTISPIVCRRYSATNSSPGYHHNHPCQPLSAPPHSTVNGHLSRPSRRLSFTHQQQIRPCNNNNQTFVYGQHQSRSPVVVNDPPLSPHPSNLSTSSQPYYFYQQQPTATFDRITADSLSSPSQLTPPGGGGGVQRYPQQQSQPSPAMMYYHPQQQQLPI